MEANCISYYAAYFGENAEIQQQIWPQKEDLHLSCHTL
jgi:hypothetical protein